MYKKIVDIVEADIKNFNDIQKDIEDIKKIYAREVADKKINKLQNKLKQDRENNLKILDELIEKKSKQRQDEISKLQNNEEYKKSRAEAMQIIFSVGDKLEIDLIKDLLKDIVEAKDLKTLRILEKKKSIENKRAYEEAISEVEAYLNNDDLEVAVSETRKILDKNKKEVNMILARVIYNNDIEAYNKLKEVIK